MHCWELSLQQLKEAKLGHPGPVPEVVQLKHSSLRAWHRLLRRASVMLQTMCTSQKTNLLSHLKDVDKTAHGQDVRLLVLSLLQRADELLYALAPPVFFSSRSVKHNENKDISKLSN